MKTEKKSERIEFWICGIFLCGGILAFQVLYFNNVMPTSTGWGAYYAELLNRGQVPYRDFAYYMPPLYLPIDWLFWNLSFGYMLLYRAWSFLPRLLAMVLLYKLLTKWFQPRYAWIACLTGACLGTASHFVLAGGYDQMTTLLCTLLAYPVSAFLEQASTQDRPCKSKGKYRYMFYSGLILSAMLLTKQSLGLAAIIVCFIFLVIYCTVFHDRDFGWYCAATAMGVVIPLLVCCSILALNGAFFPFLEQFFGMASAKGGEGAILLRALGVLDFDSLRMFCAGILLALTGRKLLAQPGKYNKCTFFLALYVFISLIHQSYGSRITTAAKMILDVASLRITYIVLVLLSIFFCACDSLPSLRKITKWNYALPVMFLFCAALVCIIINSESAFSEFYSRTGLLRAAVILTASFSQYAIIAFVAYYIFAYRASGRYVFSKSILALFVCALIDIYTHNMSAAGDPIHRSLFTTVPIFVLLLFSFKLPAWNSVKNYAVCLLCVLICALSMLQKYTEAYYWWDPKEAWPLNERTEKVGVEALAGFRLPAQMKLEYEQIVRIIEENGSEDSTVWGFPHVKIFNVLTGHYNLDDPVPVLFYDVCTDEMAEREAGWLRQSPPEFVIWCDLPGCMEAHELAYRNGGRIGQRDIIDWFVEVKADNYTLVGQVGELFVYQMKDSVPVNYTYIQDPQAKNRTIGES